MNYNEFVCHCVLRLATVINPENGKLAIPPTGCLNRAFAVADTLVKQGLMSPTLETLRNKFEIYVDPLIRAYKRRREEQILESDTIPPIDAVKREELNKLLYDKDFKVRKAARDDLDQREEMLALELSREVLELITNSIEPKKDFYAIADLLMPELSDQARTLEARKRGEEVPIAPTVERILEFLDFGNEEKNEESIDTERELIDNVDRHKKNNPYANQIHKALIANSEAEQRVKERLRQIRKAAAQA
jgi:hypothetical protein